MLLYLHGFNSSSLSEKAQQLKSYCAQHFSDMNIIVPDLPAEPKEVFVLLCSYMDNAIVRNEAIHLIGNSLGGYFATYLAEKYLPHYQNIKIVLTNPAIKPYNLIKDYLGTYTNPYTQQVFEVKEEYINELKAIDTPIIHYPDAYFVYLKSQDEVLNYREAVDKYANAKMEIHPTGYHAFEDFVEYIPDIMAYFGYS